MPVDNLDANMQTIGNYDLVEKIAEGGMGTVYRGRNHLTGEIVAVKVVPPHLLTNPVVLKRFEQEYLVAKAINHPNIVKALDFGRNGDTRYLVMEYVEGESLGQKLERDGKLPEAEAIRIISLVSLGLQKAHSLGLVHRDVKPDNVLLMPDGQVKLTDLGLVKEVEADLNLTRTGRGLGTPHFMSPEQFRNAKKADARCDIYSLGATLYMMVTGELPFKSNGPLDAWMKKINNEIEPPRQLAPELSERVDWAIRRAMSPDPTQRPESCKAFIEDLTGHTTKVTSGTSSNHAAASDYWYMVFTDEDGMVHTVKGTVKGIRRSLQEGRLGDADNVRVCQQKSGPFEPIKGFAEFRDLVIQPAKTPKPESMPKPKPTAAPATTTDSAILASTSISMTAVAAVSKSCPAAGPVINLKASQANVFADAWKWLVLGVLFFGAGALFTYYLPMLRHLRAFWPF